MAEPCHEAEPSHGAEAWCEASKPPLDADDKATGDDEASQPASRQSISGGIFILCCVTIGLSMLSMPYMFKLVGAIMIPVMLFMGGVSLYTAWLTWKAIELAQPLAESSGVPAQSRDWGYLAEVAYGKTGRVAANFCFRGELFAYILSFLCTLGVHLHMLIPAISIEQGVILSSIATFLMSYLPATLLGKVAMSAHLAYAVVVACLFYSEYASLEQTDAPDMAELIDDNFRRVGLVEALPHIPTAVSVCVYSWAGHSIVPTIAGSLKQPSNVKVVILTTFPVAVGVAMLIGLSGYLILGPYTQQVFTENLAKVYWSNPEGELLENLSWMRVLATVSVAVKLGATIPCWMHAFLLSTEAGIESLLSKTLWRAFVTTAMAIAACVFRDQVVTAVAFAGASFGNALVFLLPCTVYYGIKRRVGTVGFVEKLVLVVLLGVGSTSMVYGVYDSVRQLLQR